MSSRSFAVVVALLLLVLVFACCTDGAHICSQRDCSDVVGDYMTRDPCHGRTSRDMTDRAHLDFQEAARVKRNEILSREPFTF